MKKKTLFSCSDCGTTYSKWLGQCLSCKNWNTILEEVVLPQKKNGTRKEAGARPLAITEVGLEKKERFYTGFKEVDRVLGGGVVPGSLILLSGEPGVGKSTLLLQVAAHLSRQGEKILYVSGEESAEQLADRASRLSLLSPDIFVLPETEVETIVEQVLSFEPKLLIVDSIQVVYKAEIPSSQGSVVQVRESAHAFMALAKERGVPILLVGHITKGGEIAGPKILEHLVDTVLFFEGERHMHFRVLSSQKNRFGSTEESAVFLMGKGGLQEIENPSEFFLEERSGEMVGSIIVPILEGSRPILVEVQALVAESSFSGPIRRAVGIENSRLALYAAILENSLGMPLGKLDLFLSLLGGLKVNEPAIDIAAMLAAYSSWKKYPIDKDLIAVGEVSLNGEVRSVPRMDARLREAERLGFKKAIVPKKSYKNLQEQLKDIKMTLYPVEKLKEAFCAFAP